MINIQTESLWKIYTENSSATKIPENTFKHLLTDCTANAMFLRAAMLLTFSNIQEHRMWHVTAF